MGTHETTQIVGCSAFAIAAIAVSRKSYSRDANKLGLLAGMYAVLALEVLVEVRYLVSDYVRDLLHLAGLYSLRAYFQVSLGIAVVAIAYLFLRTLIINQANTDRVIKFAAVFSLFIFFVESISLHAVDQVLYSSAGPLPIVSWLWVVAAVLAVIGGCMR